MKTIGLIGGMSWESTVTYYQVVNETIKEQLGGFNSAKIALYSVNFAEIEAHMTKGEWDKCAEILSNAAVALEKAGADFILVCTNTLHKVISQIQAKINVPIIHIADATADALEEAKIKKVALLGTKYTMTQDFYKERLISRGISVIIPEEADIEIVNKVIFDELCCGIVSDASRVEYQRIIARLKDAGAEGVVLGCTEIGMLISQEDSVLPAFDTTLIHAQKAAFEAIR